MCIRNKYGTSKEKIFLLLYFSSSSHFLFLYLSLPEEFSFENQSENLLFGVYPQKMCALWNWSPSFRFFHLTSPFDGICKVSCFLLKRRLIFEWSSRFSWRKNFLGRAKRPETPFSLQASYTLWIILHLKLKNVSHESRGG